MKLLYCHVENFGKLHDLDLDFDQGLNCFVQENGWGKSTLAAFLCAMFYGLEDSKRDEIANERKRYFPWQGGAFGGSVCFQTGDRVYLVTRIWGKKASEDSFLLRDGETNLEVQDYTANLGQELFGLDRTSFFQTIYIRQGGCEVKATDEMHSGMGNLVQEPADMGQFEQAQQFFKDKLNNLSPSRKTGLIFRKKQQRDELRTHILETNQKEAEKTELEKQLQSIDMQIRNMEEKSLGQNGQREHIDYLKRISDINGSCGAAFSKEMNPLATAEAMADRWTNYLALEATMSVRAQNLQALERNSDPGTKKKMSPILIVAIIFLLIGIIFVVGVGGELRLSGGFMMLCGGVIAILLILGAIRKRTGVIRGDGLNSESEEDELVYQSRLYQEDEEWLLETENLVGHYLTEHGYAYAHDENSYYLQQVMKRAAAYEELQQIVGNSGEADTDGFYESEFSGIFRDESGRVGANGNESDQLSRIKSERDELIGKIRDCERVLEQRLKLRTELNAVSEELNALEREYRLTQRTCELLYQARENVLSQISKPLMDAFLTYFDEIAPEDKRSAGQFHMDAMTNLYFEEHGQWRSVAHLSMGLQDLVGLCLRMAYMEAIFTGEKPFLILDDPLVNLDNEKQEKYEHFLKSIAQKRQIIYFTCHGAK